MTRILVHLFRRIDLGPGNDSGPRSSPGFRIFNRELVIDRVGVDAAEAFGDVVSLRVRVLIDHTVIRPEIRCLHDKRVAFPMATRVTEPLMEFLSEMLTAIQG